MSRAVIDGSHIPGAQRRLKTGPSLGDRRKPGSNTTSSPTRIPLAVTLTGGNRHDVTQLLPLVDKIPPIKGIRGRPRQRHERIYADRGYDYDYYRRQLRAKGVHPGHRPTQRRPRVRTRHPTRIRRHGPGRCGPRRHHRGADGLCRAERRPVDRPTVEWAGARA
ncbi:transposase [Micromonospora zamorensis]|uniref:transposase n=1 Tax=Micromonospora zamorensis TaxID=709883 RepID=UPI0033B318EC